jgi:hypothetical protein
MPASNLTVESIIATLCIFGSLALGLAACDPSSPPLFVPLEEGCDTCPPHTRGEPMDEGVRCIPPEWTADTTDSNDSE